MDRFIFIPMNIRFRPDEGGRIATVLATARIALPEELCRHISSYLVGKIPKTDKRYTMLRQYYDHRKHMAKELFWKCDGQFRGYVIRFVDWGHLVFVIECLPNLFIEYSFHNLSAKSSTNDRCWICRNPITNYVWEQYADSGWIINPNYTG
jgi:hypothetical protein